MKQIAFICGGAKAGNNGVGDYCRALSSALQTNGITSNIFAINDSFTSQNDVRSDSNVYRFDSCASWESRTESIGSILRRSPPDLISLQFVPYSFNQKGIIRNEIKWLISLLSLAPVHIMMHELWLGLSVTDSMKNRIIGYIQRHYILSLIRKADPKIIHTSNHGYSSALSKAGFANRVLPIPSNIPFFKANEIKPTDNVRNAFENSAINIIHFGTLHPQWAPHRLLQDLCHYAASKQTRVNFVLIGRSGPSVHQLTESIRALALAELSITDLGELEPKEISYCLQMASIGLSSMPFGLLGKSGSHAAMVEHGLPVIATRNDWAIDSRQPLPNEQQGAHFFSDDGHFDIDSILTSNRNPSPRIEAIAELFLKDCAILQS